jgi:hypothetical protein
MRWLVGPLIALFTLVLMLTLGEIYFRFLFLKSDTYDFTLMAKRWKDVCWNPIYTVTSDKYFPSLKYPQGGKFDYRDRAWTDADVQGRKKIMVIGDSFVAGHGVCNAKDRLTEILQNKLGSGYAVFNVAANGWGTQEETYYPLLYPYKPDVVVLSYFVNDIRNTIITTGHNGMYPDLPPPPEWLNQEKGIPLVKDSYLVDFVYWQIIYKRQFAESSAKLWQGLLDAYAVPDIWEAHKKEMLQVFDFAKQNNAPLIVIVWPTLEKIDASTKQTAMVEQVFRENGATVISATDLFRADSPESLVVSNFDSHPNENTHRRIGEVLYTAVNALPKK